MAYYGDLSAKVLKRMGRPEPSPEAFEPCYRSLAYLKGLDRTSYKEVDVAPLPKGVIAREQLADKVGDPYARFGGNPAPVWSVAPDLRTGLDSKSVYGKSIRQRLADPLQKAIQAGNRILIIGHSLGSVLAWDVCWRFSWGQPVKPWPVDWITIGSPLGSELVKGHLRGTSKRGGQRYPKIVRKWNNVAAKGDFVCHDKVIANDFYSMTRYGACTEIRDHLIHNPALEASQSEPQHSPLGYLVHPVTISLVADWLIKDQS